MNKTKHRSRVMWGTRQKKNTIVTGGKIFFSPFRLSLSFWFTSIYTTFIKKHCSNKMNQNLDHASHVREHQKKPYEQGKNVFFSLFQPEEKKCLPPGKKNPPPQKIQ